MTELFLDVLNASYAASFVVLAVILARPLLKKAPRSLVCALWVLVAIRLLFGGLEAPNGRLFLAGRVEEEHTLDADAMGRARENDKVRFCGFVPDLERYYAMMDVLVLPSYKAALERAAKAGKALLFYENEQATTLRMALENGGYETVSLLTGPEGGLEEKEVQQAMDAGWKVCTLGKRILRCETAPLCALSAVMYHAGEF